MERATGTRFGPQRLAILVVTMAALAGCEEGLLTTEDPPEDTAAEDADNTNRFELFPEAAATNQRDVEAPEVFQVTEAGLWDGRPSLGGIWVAHPDVTQPERVLIKNTANNKSVTGALFRRERNLPGPALQVSSSAAEQLGMLAGAPTRVQVVALRREAIEEPPAPVAAEPAEETDSAESSETTDTAEASETGAAEKPQKRKWWQKKPSTEAATGAAVVAGAAVAASSNEDAPSAEAPTNAEAPTSELAANEAPAPEKPAKRKWWQKKPSDETAVAAAGAATAAAAETESPSSETQTAALSDPELTAPAEKPAKRKWWQKKDPNAITETPLDPIAGAAAAIEASEPTAAAPATASAATTSGLAKPFVQAGTFSVESNAKSAADKIRRNGMAAEVMELKSEDKSVWRVLVGPVATRAERRAMLNDVKDLGFTDAFTAKN